MKLEELLNEEYLDILCEASTREIRYRKSKAGAIKKAREVAHKREEKKKNTIDPDARVGLTSKARTNIQRHQYINSDYNDKKDSDKYKPGRERLVAAVTRLVRQNGGAIGISEVRDYVYEKYKQWASSSPEAKAILKLEKRAKALGFNPRNYKNQKPGQSAGKGQKGSPEYSGRAFFFTALMNMFGNHFLKEQGITMTKRFAHLKPVRKGSEEDKKIKERERNRQIKMFHSK